MNGGPKFWIHNQNCVVVGTYVDILHSFRWTVDHCVVRSCLHVVRLWLNIIIIIEKPSRLLSLCFFLIFCFSFLFLLVVQFVRARPCHWLIRRKYIPSTTIPKNERNRNFWINRRVYEIEIYIPLHHWIYCTLRVSTFVRETSMCVNNT